MSERDIIKKLRESRFVPRLDENRRSPFDIFVAQLDGTLSRLESINEKFNTPAQQDILNTFIIGHLRFLSDNKDAIQKIIETPEGQSTGLNVNDYLLESHRKIYRGTFRVDESTNKAVEMFVREFEELYDRAKQLKSKYTDTEQSREYDLIVMSRLAYINRSKPHILRIFEADEEQELRDVTKSIRSQLILAKMRT